MGSIGRYRIVKKLATGGMAEVYLAKVAGPGGFEKQVVVKQILPQLADSELYVKMFLDEARLAAQLDHPNVVHVFDFGEVDGSYFLAMEYVEGANLRHVMRWASRAGHVVPPPLCARIVALACEGLAHAHQTGKLVHRDVSPENIMLSRAGAVKVLDFGVAKVTSEDNRSKVGSLKGKIAYMPPEQLKGADIDHRVDIYALGIVLYQALSGKRPYGQATDVALIQAILNEEPTPLLKHRLDLPDNLLEIVSKAMAKRPQDRFQSCDALRDALEEYIAHEGQPANAAQIAQLVAAYQAGTAEPQPKVKFDAGTQGSVGLSVGDSSPGQGPPATQLERAALQAPQTSPGMPGPFHAAGLEGVAPLRAGEAPGPWPTGWALARATDSGKLRSPVAGAADDTGPRLPMPREDNVEPRVVEALSRPAPDAANEAAPAETGPGRVPERAAALGDMPLLDSGVIAMPRFDIDVALPSSASSESPEPLTSPMGNAQRAVALAASAPDAEWAVPASAATDIETAAISPAALAEALARTRQPPSSAPVLRPSAGPPPARGVPVGVGSRPTAEQPRPSAPRADDAQAHRAWAPTSAAPEPVRHALRESLRADRSTTLLRKLPAVIGRLTEFSTTIPWSMAEAFSGLVDAALLCDDHGAIVRILDRAALRPGPDARFAAMVAGELMSPLRIAWLVERLRSGLPVDTAGLRSWLLRLGAQAGPLFLSALEMSDLGPAQELFAEALAAALPSDPGLVVSRLREPDLRHLAGLSFALEKSGAPERNKVFQRLIGRRDVAQQVEILTGRARARGADALLLLEAALGDRSDEVRRRAVKLIGELCGAKGYALLLKSLKDPAFETRPAPERALLWAAALECGGDAAVAFVEEVLAAKALLLNKKKVNDAKLGLIEGLGRARNEAARTQLEMLVADRSQGDDVVAAAAAALEGNRRAANEQSSEHRAIGEWRTHLMARVSLDFALLARAATTVDVASGMLDSALERFRDGVRQLVQQDGKLQLVVTEGCAAVNGTPVGFGPLDEPVSSAIVSAMQVRDLQGFAVEAMLPATEFRGLLLRAFDPEGARERLPHIKALTFGGALLAAQPDPPLHSDATARSRELFAQVVRWLSVQRDSLRADRALDLASGEPTLEEWARLLDSGQARFMGLARWQTSDTGTLVHTANTALIAMAFAHDLGLTRSALREAAEVALMLGLAESVVKPERRPQPGEPTGEDERFYASGLVLTNRVNRLGTAAAVGAVEAGMPHGGKGGPGIVASIHALAKAFDALTAGTGATAGQALETINGRLRSRFNPDLVGLFTQWALAQPPPG